MVSKYRDPNGIRTRDLHRDRVTSTPLLYRTKRGHYSYGTFALCIPWRQYLIVLSL